MDKLNINRINNDLFKNKKCIPSYRTNSFAEILNKINTNNSELKFSKHALERLKERNIDLTSSQIRRLKTAFDKARNKGIRDALILMDEYIFIASIKNNTVITSSRKEKIAENIFTNIDGAVII